MNVPDQLNVGVITKPQGLRGEVRVKLITDMPEDRFAKDRKLSLHHERLSSPLTVTVQYSRPHKELYVVKFYEFDSINDVEPYRGAMLKVSLSDVEPLPENEYFFHEIIGCDVWTMDGHRIGTVTAILTPGANDVWVVKREQSNREIYIPYIDEIVKTVEPTKKRIVIEWMDGLE